MRTTLAKLKQEGKKLFLTADAHWEYVNFTMKASLGDDWLNFFDYCLVIVNAFRFANEYAPFRELALTSIDLKGPKLREAN
jgi:hypothetical protein